ncbi:MAG: glycoside hydrolase family 2 TIM barrel-domain containing protein [Clostridia bacterium]
MFNITDQNWCNLNVLEKKRLPPRSVFYPFLNQLPDEMGASDRTQRLSGIWRFKWLPSAMQSDMEEVLLGATEEMGYRDIQVPRSWQHAGYGRFLYTDEAYPFPLDPPFVPAKNETGVYKRKIDIQDGFERYTLRLEGAESCAEVYVNGQFAGYTQGSRLAAEFEISPYVHIGENDLCIVVHMFCDGTYLEDQDMWWLGGLMRDVYLIRRKASGIQNLLLNADYCAQTGGGTLALKVEVFGAGKPSYKLLDADGRCVGEQINAPVSLTLSLPTVTPWNAEEPYLYTLLLSVMDESGAEVETVCQRVGFRHVEIQGGTLLLNGARIMLRGVNRHEYSAINGRAVSYSDTKADLLLMKKYHINAVRTSHYPNAPFFYDLCDELGLYVMDECDLETHGFEIEGVPFCLVEDERWKNAYLDRARRTVARDRNHACVLMWSLGNESYWGSNFSAMYEYIKAEDPTRPVHYEGDRAGDSADVTSTMYSSIGLLQELDMSIKGKPHILCEFCHAMGNGPGSIAEYVEFMEHSQRIQGYFVWEWRDHGVKTIREDGTICYRYGGEFGEDYTSSNFCMDGLLSSDNTPTPGFHAFAKAIEPLHVTMEDQARASMVNRFAFRTLRDVLAVWTLRCDGEIVAQAEETLPLLVPQGRMMLCAPADLLGLAERACGHATLTLECRHGEEELGWGAYVVKRYQPACAIVRGELSVEEKADLLLVRGEGFSVAVSMMDGRLKDFRMQDRLLLIDGPMLDFFRAYIDNDRIPQKLWEEKNLHSMSVTVTDVSWAELGDSILISIGARIGANARNWRVPTKIEYRIFADGTMKVRFFGRFDGDFGMGYLQEVPRVGTTLSVPAVFEQALYLGCGPDETYVDSRHNSRKDVFTSTVANMAFPYECPQDSGNRTDTDLLVLHDGQVGIAFATLEPKDISVHTCTAKDLWKTAHHADLPVRDELEVHIDQINSGLGSGSCGPQHMRGYMAQTVPFDFDYALAPVLDGNPLNSARHTQNVLAYSWQDGRKEHVS